MTNEALRAQVTDLVASVRDYVAATVRARDQRAQLMATAEAAEGRILVTVNADGIVIDIEFTEDIDELDYAEIAAATCTAAQDAAAAVARAAAEIMRATRIPGGLPDYSEILPGLPDLDALRNLLPPAPKVSTAPPDSQSRSATTADRGPGSVVRDGGW